MPQKAPSGYPYKFYRSRSGKWLHPPPTGALHAVAEVQKRGGIAGFIDAEHALDPAYAKNIGVDIDNLYISQPDNGEQALEITETMVRSGAVDIKGKRVTVVGRSLVIGKPVAMLLMKRNATVTVVHTKTVDMAATCKHAEILVAAAGSAKMIKPQYVADGAVVIDVGINVDEEGKLCGDVDFEAIGNIASIATPVPGGVGSVTTSVLAKHLVKAAHMR